MEEPSEAWSGSGGGGGGVGAAVFREPVHLALKRCGVSSRSILRVVALRIKDQSNHHARHVQRARGAFDHRLKGTRPSVSATRMGLCQELPDCLAGGCTSWQEDGGYARKGGPQRRLCGDDPRPVPRRTWQAVSVEQNPQSLPLKPSAQGSQATKYLSQS